MALALVSFLGKSSNGYRQASYRFEDGTVHQEKFFGLALTKQLQPDRLVFLGTAGSMWDALVEHVGAAEGGSEDERLGLIDAAKAGRVTQAHLTAVRPQVEAWLGRPVDMVLIPYGHNFEEQTRILQLVADALRPGEHTALDVTHGLRHLPMLGLLSALYLRQVRGVKVEGLYYGALDMTDADLTPVLRLDGLLHLADWLSALSAYDLSNNFSPFADLLAKDGVPAEVVSRLRQASFHERISDAPAARSHIKVVDKHLVQNPLRGAGALFETSLRERLSWHSEERLHFRQRALARSYLDKRDYLRASLYAHEAVITAQVPRTPGSDAENYADRQESKKNFEAALHGGQKSRYWLLCTLRNALAHGTRPESGEAEALLNDEAKLATTLHQLLEESDAWGKPS